MLIAAEKLKMKNTTSEPEPDEINAPEFSLDKEEIPDGLCSFIYLVITLAVILFVILIPGVRDEVFSLFR